MALEADEFVFFDAREAALAPVDEVAVFLLYDCSLLDFFATFLAQIFEQKQLAAAVDVVQAKVKVSQHVNRVSDRPHACRQQSAPTAQSQCL